MAESAMCVIVGFVIGTASWFFLYAMMSECVDKNDPCNHEWGKWERYGLSYQQRRCKRCGKYEIEEQ